VCLLVGVLIKRQAMYI